MSFKAYDEYKDSGAEWLGEVPEHWQVKRLSHFFDERREKASDKEFAALSVTMKGIVPRLDNAAKTQDGDNRKKVCNGDFVINSRSDRKGSAGLSPLDGSVSLICTVLTPKTVVGSYIHHLLRSIPFQEEFYRFGKGIVADLWSTNYSEMKNINLAMPPIKEQTTIAAFLDHETARIDALIEEQQRLIALLKEKRQAVISHAVTKGLDPNLPMKDSGVEWLGDVPAHWDAITFQRILTNIEQGWSPNASNVPAEPGSWGVIKLSSIKKGRFAPEENKSLLQETLPLKKYMIKNGDLLVTRANTPDLVADACVVKDIGDSMLMLSDLVYRLTTTSLATKDFICWVLISKIGRSQIEADARGSSMSMAKVSQSHIKSWHLALPDIKEQINIADYIEKKVYGIDSMIKQSSHSLELLQERRSALISAAVTGKIDVRDWQLPEASQTAAEPAEASA